MYIKTLNKFIEWVGQFKDHQYLFRGVSNECYKLEASICRRLPKADKCNPSKSLKINQELIDKARSLGHDVKDGRQLSDLELLAELQHYGAATCLIDFTRSALIALWFACQQSSSREEANGKVYAVPHDDIVRLKTVNSDLITKDIDYFLKPDENGRYRLYQWQPKLQNNRIIAQQSVFLFSGRKIEEDIKCIIDKDSKQDILTSLEQISGITEASIYPDFDGFARLHAHNKSYIEPDAQDYLRRGFETHQNNNLDSAIEYYTEAIRLNLRYAYAYNNRGYAYHQKGEFERAIKDYDQAIQIKRDSVRFYRNRAIALLHLQEWKKAKSDLTIAKNMGTDIVALFRNSFSSIADFEEKYSIEMPEDIAVLLTSPQV